MAAAKADHLPVLILAFVLLIHSTSTTAPAQVKEDNRIAVGGILGDPLGVALNYPLDSRRAIDLGFGPDYFGSPRLQLDYIWQFRAFKSEFVGVYTGPGLAIAFAKGTNPFFSREPHKESFASREDDGFGLGGRAIFGMRFTPRSSPLEFFIESGPVVALRRIFDLDYDGALGILYKL